MSSSNLFHVGEDHTFFFNGSISIHNSFSTLHSLMRTLKPYEEVQYPENAVRLAEGYEYYSSYTKKVMDVFKDNVISTDHYPIMIQGSWTVVSEIQTSQFLNVSKNISKPRHPDQIYPIAVRYIDSNGIFYIERPPSKIDVDFRSTKKSTNQFPKKIWIPWTIMVINPANIYRSKLFFSHKSLSEMSDKYVPSYLPNTYIDGALCLSSSINYITQSISSDMSDFDMRWVFSSLYNEYINGGWNTDLPLQLESLYSFSDISEEDKKNYPMLTRYFNVTEEEICAANPEVKRISISNLLKEKNSLHYASRITQYKYMFFAMSTFTLEETLAFYEDAFSFLDKLKYNFFPSFTNIIEKSNEEISSKSLRQVSNISSTLQLNNVVSNTDNTGLMFNASIIIHNYTDNQEIKDAIYNNIYYVDEYVASGIDPKIYTDIVLDVINRSKLHNHVYIIDVKNNTYEYHQIDTHSASVENFYYQYIKDNYCIALEEYRNINNIEKDTLTV